MVKGDRAKVATLVLAVTAVTILPACATSGPGQGTESGQTETSGEASFQNIPPKPGLLPDTLEQIRRSRFVPLAADEARGPNAGLLVDDSGTRVHLAVSSGGPDGTWRVIDRDARFTYQITSEAYSMLTNPELQISDGKLVAGDGVWALEAHWDGYAELIRP